MDPFDDILPSAPAARARPGTRFMPKARSKQLPRKETSSEHATSSKVGISGKESQNLVASTLLSTQAEESMGSNPHPQVDIPNSDDATNTESGNPQQVNVKGDTVALVDDHLPSTITASEVDANQNFTNFQNSPCEMDRVDFEVGSVTNIIPDANLSNGITQPAQHANAVENELNNVAAASKICSTIDRMQEPPKNGEASNIHSKSNSEREQKVVSVEFELDPFDSVLPDPGARTAHKFQPKIKPRPRVGNTPVIASASSNVMMERPVKLPTCTNEFQSFHSSSDDNSRLNQSTSLPIPTSEIPRTSDLSDKFNYMSSSIPFSEDNRSLAAAIPSQLDPLNDMLSEVAVHNGTRDWPSSFGKSSGEAADIFSGLESLDDFLTQAATNTGKPAIHSFNEKGTEENFVAPACSSITSFGVCDTTQAQRYPEDHTTRDSLTFNEAAVPIEDDTHTNNRRSETEEVMELDPTCPGDNVFDYQSMKSAADPTSEIPVHEELTNAADSPTLADFLCADVTKEKEIRNDASTSSSLRKTRRSSMAGEEDKGGKTSRQLRKQAAHKPANNSLNEDVDDNDDLDPPYNSNGDELEENDVDNDVDYPSKKKRVSTVSKKKLVAKNGKTSQKRKKANDDAEKTTKEPPKKFSHSAQRRKRCVDKALLEIPEDELDPLTLPIKDIILLAEYRERLAKKEGSTLKTSSAFQSGGYFFHETDANNEEEMFGSEDGRDPDDDQANESIPSAPSLFNYQSFMEKAPRGKWSKQDNELFYQAVRQFGTDFSMIQQLFPHKTRHQIKLKYKKEERQHPIELSDAVNNRSKDLSHFKLVIERLQQASTKAEEDLSRDASDFMTGEEVVDITPGTNNEEVTPTEQDTDVKAQEDSVAVHSPEQSDDDDDDFQLWSQYKSVY